MRTQLENPNGLHQKYLIQKIVHTPDSLESKVYGNEWSVLPVDSGFEGFVLRLDKGGDPKHVEACRKAILIYAEEIKDYLPELSKDLIEKYS
jgi:hypothetical protein